MNFDIDITIVVGFLLINLIAGLYYGRGVSNIKEYALGNQQFSTATITATIIATWLGGSGFALSISETYKNGIWYIFAGSGYAFNLMVVAYLFSKKIKAFEGSLSVAETMGKLYGSEVRIITAIASIASTLAVLALQIKVFSSVFGYFLGISASYATVASTFVIVMYSAFGGIKAVTFTDVIQLITFGVVVPIFAVFVWKTLDGHSIEHTLSSASLFNYKTLLSYDSEKTFKYISIFLAGLIPALNPTVFQRMLIAKDGQQIKRTFFISSLVCLIIYLITCFIGFVVFFHDPNLNPEHLSLYIIDNYSYAGIKSFALIGIMAMVMSTADSWINTSSIIFSHDLCKPLGLNQKYELLLSRVFTLFLGIAVVAITLSYEHLLDLVFLSENFYIPIVTPILMLAILGFYSTKRVALIAISAGITTTIIWKNFIQPFTEIESVVPGMFINMVTFFLVHHLLGEPGGWINDKEILDSTTISRKNSIKLFFKNCIGELKHIVRPHYYSSYLPKQTIIYQYFAFSVFLTLIATISIEDDIYKNSMVMVNGLQAIALTIATFFLCNALWPLFLKHYHIGVIWVSSIFVSLVLISGFLVLLSKFSHVSLTILTLHLTLVPILVGWRMALVMIGMGLGASLIWYQSYISGEIPAEINDIKLKLFYILFIVGGFSITILKTKQEYLEAKEDEIDELEYENVNLGQEVSNLNVKVTDLDEKVTHFSQRVSDQSKEIERLGATAQKILNNVNHELRLPVGNVMNFAEMLSGGLGKYNKKQLKELSDEVFKNSNRLSTMILNMLDLAMLDVKKIELNKKTINLSELIEDRVDQCRKIYLQGKNIEFELELEPVIMVSVDPNYIRQTIDNLVINAINYSKEGAIKVSALVQGKNMVVITIQDEGIGIPRSELFDIFTPFKMGTNTESKAEGRGVGLALCKAAIEAHGGEIKVDSNGRGAIFKVVLNIG